jgi:hypothetical protein
MKPGSMLQSVIQIGDLKRHVGYKSKSEVGNAAGDVLILAGSGGGAA